MESNVPTKKNERKKGYAQLAKHKESRANLEISSSSSLQIFLNNSCDLQIRSLRSLNKAAWHKKSIMVHNIVE